MSLDKHKMQGQQSALRQTDQSPILQQPGNIVIKMNETIQPITTVGKYQHPARIASNMRSASGAIRSIHYFNPDQLKFLSRIDMLMLSIQIENAFYGGFFFLFAPLYVAILNTTRM